MHVRPFVILTHKRPDDGRDRDGDGGDGVCSRILLFFPLSPGQREKYTEDTGKHVTIPKVYLGCVGREGENAIPICSFPFPFPWDKKFHAPLPPPEATQHGRCTWCGQPRCMTGDNEMRWVAAIAFAEFVCLSVVLRGRSRTYDSTSSSPRLLLHDQRIL